MYLLFALIALVFIVFIWSMFISNEYATNYDAGGGYLSRYVHGKSFGKPLADTVYTSGASLRDYGTVFSSTDQGRHEQL